jgi:hypothetical protein
MSIGATLIVCDDIRFEANGKFIVVGAYTGDIAIANAGDMTWQTIFLFSVDCPIATYPRRMEFSVTLPGHPPDISVYDVPDFVRTGLSGRWPYRHIIHVRHRVLNPGGIAARVICDSQVIDVAAPRISVVPQVAAS